MAKTKVRIKQEKDPWRVSHTVRLSVEERRAIKDKAEEYTQGNMSDWIRHSALNYVPPKDALEKVE